MSARQDDCYFTMTRTPFHGSHSFTFTFRGYDTRALRDGSSERAVVSSQSDHCEIPTNDQPDDEMCSAPGL